MTQEVEWDVGVLPHLWMWHEVRASGRRTSSIRPLL
jgi:hypothetical protein